MILVSFALAILVQDVVAETPSAALAAAQAKALSAHRLFRERTRGAQLCEPQTLQALSTANRLAVEAVQRRQKVLSAIEAEGQAGSAPITAEPADAELGRAVDLLRRDMETSAVMLSKASPGEEGPPPSVSDVLARVDALQRVDLLKTVASGQNQNGVLLPTTLARDLAIEENLTQAYYSAARAEIERACLEKPPVSDDPFRVPVRPVKPAAKPSRKGAPQ